ncbi:putative mechanosensitive ion channel family protein [Zalerion maritima]|uniref:Mechanosensitive ion channel protein n=1 Tax=Zalerion maritima TaxID=339359 RepID=A0AAD5WNA7_9PEZI|nr:putative mechanosensitive ion channel family protein [Zalerion maritima]
MASLTPHDPREGRDSDRDREREFDEKGTVSTLAPDLELQNSLSPRDSSKEQVSRLNDDLELLRAEQLVSNREHDLEKQTSRRHQREPEDTFNPREDEDKVTQPVDEPNFLNRIWLKLKKFPRFVRYFLYLLPVALILLIPILLSIYVFDDGKAPIGGTGGVKLRWFGIWLETVWLSLWAARIVTAIIPYIFKILASVLGSTNGKNWKDIGHQLELPTAIFFWLLAVLISFLPIVNNHRAPNPALKDGELTDITWINVVQKIIIACFSLAAMNFVEKILMQWIAVSFHQRTYAKRIEDHKIALAYLVKLYEHSKTKINCEDSIWEAAGGDPGSGARTPLRALQNNARNVVSGVGNVVNRMAGDFTGRKFKVNHPRKVVLEMIKTTESAQTLARLIFRSLHDGDSEVITLKNMELAFEAQEEADACFNLLDRDLNGDLTMAELEGTCDEIHREKKAIAANVKDLDSVIKKLDNVFLTICIIITIIVFVSIISGSAASALASAGTAVLGLAWVLQSTAQEFLQSVIFVFVKHPYDVGDRVTIYGNTGTTLTGDDYYVTEIHLLFTAFKKLEGHIVQAPNSVLNSLFILNHQRSSGLADPIPLVMRFGTAPDLIEQLKERMLMFVEENKRDYQSKIITEVKSIDEVYSFTMNFIFFHKSSFQNELIRLNRHNKFVSQLMYEMHNLGIEGPRRQQPGGNPQYPFYWTQVSPPTYRSSEVAASGPVPTGPTIHSIPEEHPGDSNGAIGSSGIASGVAQKVPSHSSSVLRNRADSHASYMGQHNTGTDFQDVFEFRRADNVNRGASVHSHNTVEQLRQQEERDRELERQISQNSESRRHLFHGRPKKNRGTWEV